MSLHVLFKKVQHQTEQGCPQGHIDTLSVTILTSQEQGNIKTTPSYITRQVNVPIIAGWAVLNMCFHFQ